MSNQTITAGRAGTVAALLACLVPAYAEAAASIEVLENYSPARAPTGVPGQFFYVSPSFNAYRDNVMQGLLQGLDAFGPADSPTRFESFNRSTFSIFETTGTPFNSWLGETSPEGAYAGEFGTFVRTALRVESDDPFTIADVLYTYVDDIGTNVSRTFAAAGFRFGPTFIGLTASGDLLDNTADDTTQSIVGLYYFGFANINVWGRITPADFAASGQTTAEFYNGINDLYVDDPYSFTESYFLTLGGVVVASDVFQGQIVETPAPTALALFGLGVLALARRRRS